MKLLSQKQQIKRTILRLTHAERVMREVAKKPAVCFDMDRWGWKWNMEHEEAPPCGTTACAAGWMGLDPRMRRMGIKTVEGFNGCGSLNIEFDEIVNRGFGTFGRLEQFFGITRNETSELFDNDKSMDEENKTPITKANQIAKMRQSYERQLEKLSKP